MTDSSSSLPTTHKVWRMTSSVKDLKDVNSIKESLLLEEEPIPTVKDGQILVQVACCTINNEDTLHLQNAYINTKDVPMPRGVGFEGSGTVVASKAPFYLGLKVWTRVAFYADQGDAVREYLVLDAMTVTPIPSPQVTYGTAAAAVTNPFTVLLMVHKVKKAGHKVVLNTVGAGALGRLFTKHAKSVGIDVIALVRRDAQKELCVADGAKVVLNMSDPDFDQQLAKSIKETNCRFAYDGLGGDMPDRLLKALPNHSVVSMYSSIVSTQVTIDSDNLYHEKRIEAFNAGDEMKTLWTVQLMPLMTKLQKWMATPDMQTQIRQQYDFDKLPEAVCSSETENKSDGKVQVVVNPSLK